MMGCRWVHCLAVLGLLLCTLLGHSGAFAGCDSGAISGSVAWSIGAVPEFLETSSDTRKHDGGSKLTSVKVQNQLNQLRCKEHAQANQIGACFSFQFFSFFRVI